MDAVKCDLQFSSFEIGLKALFAFAYSTSCLLDDQPLTPSEQQTIRELEDLEVLDNLKALLVDLLNVKRDVKATEQAELKQRNEKFEGMLQKLEAEVRTHIRIEQQLRLHLEAAQARVEELTTVQCAGKEGEKLRQTTGKDRGLLLGQRTRRSSDAECEQLKSQLREKQQEVKSLKQDYKSLLLKYQSFKARFRSADSSHREEASDSLIAHRTEVLSPYKEKPKSVYIRTIYHTYVTGEFAKAKKHGRSGSDRTWKRTESTRRSRPNSSLKV